MMLRLVGVQVESLFDEALPAGVRELPPDLARLDELLADESLLAPIARAWQATARDHGRPTIAMATFVRLMVVRHEAMRIRERRCRELSLDAVDLQPSAEQPDIDREPDPRMPELRAALRQLKPDQRRALLLFYGMDRGEGGRYRRIMRATGWSYTKVNRCLTEGRATLRRLLVDEPPATNGVSPGITHPAPKGILR